MPDPVVRPCPHCANAIDVRKGWKSAPKTRLGLPFGIWTSGRPGMTCSGCGSVVVLTTRAMTAYVVIQWIFFVLLACVAYDRSDRSNTALAVVVGMVLVVSLLQWFTAPFLIGLRPREVDEKVNISRQL